MAEAAHIARGPAPKVGIGFGRRLRAAHMAFSRAFRTELGRRDITFGQFVHLERLWDEDGLSQAELSRRAGVETASSTGILSELEAIGLIKRVRSESDRRKIHLFLTLEGAALKDPLLDCARAVNRAARLGIGEREIAEAFRVLEQVVENLAELYPAQGGHATTRGRLGL